ESSDHPERFPELQRPAFGFTPTVNKAAPGCWPRRKGIDFKSRKKTIEGFRASQGMSGRLGQDAMEGKGLYHSAKAWLFIVDGDSVSLLRQENRETHPGKTSADDVNGTHGLPSKRA